MSIASINGSMAFAVLSQFMSPNTSFDMCPAAERMPSRGKGFANFNEFANMISRGSPTKFVDELMEAFSHHSNALSQEDTCAILNLYILVLIIDIGHKDTLLIIPPLVPLISISLEITTRLR